MKVLLIADGRSPITQRWLASLTQLGYDIVLVSSYPCPTAAGVSAQYLLPVAFAGSAGSQSGGGAASGRKKLVSQFRSVLMKARYQMGPRTLPKQGASLAGIIDAEQPDLVHALRIPFEGMLGSFTPEEIPFAVSVWGNDLTLHSQGSAAMARYTLRTLQRADGLAADARRDIRLGRLHGFAEGKPTLVIPGAGGIDLDLINRSTQVDDGGAIREKVPMVINPRGFRPGSVQNDTFFNAIPIVLGKMPATNFVCVAMEGQPDALRWVQALKLDERVKLTPFLTQPQLWSLFKMASVSVSYSSHDGLPNSLLEAMACGCFPIVGDIESLREWITPGVNGLLIPPQSVSALADAILAALENQPMRERAAAYNLQLVRDKAQTEDLLHSLDAFYKDVIYWKQRSG